MSFLKKLGAVVVGAGSAAGWLACNAVKAALESTADKIGNGSVTDSKGNTYTARDYRDKANSLEKKDSLWNDGFDKAKELWKDEN